MGLMLCLCCSDQVRMGNGAVWVDLRTYGSHLLCPGVRLRRADGQRIRRRNGPSLLVAQGMRVLMLPSRARRGGLGSVLTNCCRAAARCPIGPSHGDATRHPGPVSGHERPGAHRKIKGVLTVMMTVYQRRDRDFNPFSPIAVKNTPPGELGESP